MPLVLIVDDQVTNCSIYSKLAVSAAEDVTAKTFTDALEALDWFNDNPVDLVITDYKMPQLDGSEFIRRLRSMPEGADIPVVVITSYHDRNFRMRALQAGATDFLLSPIDHCEFSVRVRNLLELRRHQKLLKGRTQLLERELERSEQSRDKLLRDSRQALAQVIDTVPAMISAADTNGRCIFANAYYAALAGASISELLGRDAAECFGPAYAQRSRELDRLILETNRPLQDAEDEILDCDGARRALLITKTPLREAAGKVIGVLTTAVDITDRKQAEGRLRQMAHHDALTGLPNRYVLRRNLRLELVRSRRGSGAFALHFMDLDRFKSINDAFGHQVGDHLLAMVARRLTEAMRPGETIARLGGDEFAVLQPGVEKPEAAEECASRLLAALSAPFQCRGRSLTVGASIGITLFPRDGQDANEILRCADLAMYQAKAEGRGTFRLFEAGMDRRARETMALEADLRAALEREEFVLHFQPQLDLRTGLIAGVEALLRWQRPGFGLVAPSRFLPLAEETGLIAPINEWVIRTACAQAAVWGRTPLGPLRMAVNLSPTQFRSHDVRQVVEKALAETQLPAEFLELELTEGILFEHQKAVQTLLELRELGVRFSIDDFGTGYSSLSYIKQFPVHRLKIDQSFVRNLETDLNDAAIVRAVVNLGRSLRLSVTAEGVETAEQMNHLRAEGCDEIQGFYFSPALPAEDCQELLRRTGVLPHAAGLSAVADTRKPAIPHRSR